MEAETTVIIPNWNTRRWLPGCLDGLRKQNYQDFQVLLVDNGSTDGSISFVRQHYPEVQVLAFDRNRGFASAVNAGIRQTESTYVALLNVDTIPQPGWLFHLVAAIQRSPDVGCVASRMLKLKNPDLIDDAGDTFSWFGSARKRGQGEPAEHYNQLEEVLSACAGAALYRRTLLEKLDGFDESFVSYLEDIDLGLRARLIGYRCLYAPDAKVLHQGHGAGIARSQYVYLMTRNRLAIVTKNIPFSLLWKHLWNLLYGQIYFFLVYKRPLHSMIGTLAWLIALPQLLRQRRKIQARQVISDQVLESMLSNELGEIPLREIIANKLLS
jgi:GT2 family glycosyltransferase